MARSKFGVGHFFLLAVLLALILILRSRLEAPRSIPSRRSGQHRGHQLSPEYGRRDQYPESRRHEYGEQTAPACGAFGSTCDSRYFRPWTAPSKGACRVRIIDGYPAPDPRCTPGGVNLSVSEDVLRNADWRTGCIRNCQTSEAEKHVTYMWYAIRKRYDNAGDDQVCELDHLVPLELGGADGLGNIWPECGPDSVALHNRYFKLKDRVEDYLADEVKSGRMPLDTAQHGIASNWTQYLPAANAYCEASGHC